MASDRLRQGRLAGVIDIQDAVLSHQGEELLLMVGHAGGKRRNVPVQVGVALLAAKAGASYVSPFVGRLDDIAHSGMELVKQIIDIYANYLFETEIIVASIRNPLHVLEAAKMGADVATIPFNVIKQLAQHPLTDAGLQKFLQDWSRVEKK